MPIQNPSSEPPIPTTSSPLPKRGKQVFGHQPLATQRLSNGDLPYIDNCTFHVVENVDQPVHVTDSNPSIIERRPRAARQHVNVRTLAANENDLLSELDAGMHFRGKHIADKRIAERDQMHVSRE